MVLAFDALNAVLRLQLSEIHALPLQRPHHTTKTPLGTFRVNHEAED